MSASSILLLFVVFFIIEFLWEQSLVLLNMGSVKRHREAVPAAFRGYVSEDTYRKSVEYTLARSRFSLLSSAVSAVFLLLFIVSGALGRIDLLLSGLGLHPYFHGMLYVFLLALLFRLLSLPFSLYAQFVIEERFGFNRMTRRLYFIDQLKGLAISAVLLAPLLAGLFWFMDTAGAFWWVYAFLFLVLFQLLVTTLYPTVIAPLFNKFSPLAEGSLKERLSALARELEFRTKGIFVMDGSRRSGHSNAYFTGLGKAKRIVLFDTLVTSMNADQVVSVLAHEIGHEKKRHVVQRLLVSSLLSGFFFFLLALLLPYEPLYHAFGFTAPSYHAILVILSVASGPFTFFFTPLFSIWSRKHEYEADRFAVDAVGTAAHLRNALLDLGKDNLSNFTPHPLYSFYHYSHPTLSERIQAMETYAKENGTGA